MEPVGLPEAGALAIRSVEGPAAPPKHRRRAVETVSRPRRKQAETGVGAPVAVRTPASGPPRLVVTGIAYQEDRLGRLAIVNDQPLGEGEKVGGAVISVILEDRVQFSRAGETFEIPLTKAGSSRR
jgi:general secretion pathway protein B